MLYVWHQKQDAIIVVQHILSKVFFIFRDGLEAFYIALGHVNLIFHRRAINNVKFTAYANL